LVTAAIAIAVSVPLAYVQRAQADKWDDKIASLQAKADQYQAQADKLKAKADTLQNKLDQITAQVKALQTKIDINQKKHDKLQADITANQKKLDNTQDTLGEILANLYVDSDISPLEMLASSQNISDFVDKQEYRSSVRDQLNSTITDIKNIKKQLEDDKAAVDKVLTEQKSQRAQLAATQSEQASLVAQTRGSEAAYKRLVNNVRSQMESAAAQQRAYYAALQAQGGGDSGVVGNFVYANWSGNQGCGGGGYPYCAGPLDYNYPNGSQYALFYRECVDYVAWRMNHVYHKRVGSFGGVGMAYQWINWDGNRGTAYKLGAVPTSNPQPGDAVVLPATYGFAPVGHVMIVEYTSGDWVHVSQYNFYGTGEYSTMDIKKSGVVFLRFPSD